MVVLGFLEIKMMRVSNKNAKSGPAEDLLLLRPITVWVGIAMLRIC
jgi:hypothetical protein